MKVSGYQLFTFYMHYGLWLLVSSTLLITTGGGHPLKLAAGPSSARKPKGTVLILSCIGPGLSLSMRGNQLAANQSLKPLCCAEWVHSCMHIQA